MTAGKRLQLISPQFLVILCLMVAAVFFGLVLSGSNFERDLDDLPPEALTIAYLKVVLQADPDNVAVRLKLARQYLALGEWRQAEALLAAAGGEVLEQSSQMHWLLMQTRFLELTALPPDDRRRAKREAAFLRQLYDLLATDLDNGQLAQSADYQLQLGRPAEAAAIYLRLALRQSEQAARWYTAAGRWYLAAGRSLDAGHAYERAYGLSPMAELALAGAEAYSAAGRDDLALALVRRGVERQPRQPQLLARGVTLARRQNLPAVARAWNRRYLELQPRDTTALVLQIELAAGMGAKAEALAASRRYVALHPEDWAGLRRHAQLAEWNARYPEALATWKKLAAREQDPWIYRHMRQIAQVGYETAVEFDILAFLGRQPNLKEAEALELADRYEYLGATDRADALLAQFDRRHPSRAALIAQALIRERTGDLEGALAVRTRIISRSDAQSGDRIQRARLLLQLGREAEALAAVHDLPLTTLREDTYALSLVGELAWQQGDDALAAAAYRALWPQADGDLRTLARRRLLLAYRQLGRSAEAVALLAQGWRQQSDPQDLLAALIESRQQEFWPQVDRLLREAEAAQDLFAAEPSYWQIKGDWYARRQHHDQAYAAYRRALALEPQSQSAAEGILWSLINGHRHSQLARYLDYHNRQRLPQTEAYAAALQALGRDAEALAWYEGHRAGHQTDALWLLTYADLLDRVERPRSARAVRQQALALLQNQRSTRPDARQAVVMAELQGVPQAWSWLTTQDTPGTQEAVLNWWLYRQRDDAARRWLLQQHIERSRLPAWQQLQLALMSQDQQAVGRLLAQGQLGEATDRMQGYSFLGAHDRALAELGTAAAMTPGLRTAAAQAAAHLPNQWDLGSRFQHLGALELFDQTVEGWVSRGRFSLGVDAAIARFRAQDDLGLRQEPDDEIRLMTHLRWRHGGTWGLDLGRRDGTGGSTVPWDLWYDTAVGRRGSLRAGIADNGLTEASGLLRLLGVRDRAYLRGTLRLAPRWQLAAAGELHRYQGLEGADLADGWASDLTLTCTLAEGRTKALLRGNLAWEENDLQPQLPAQLSSLLVAGAGVSTVVPARFYAAGVSLYLARGELRSVFPQVASPRWFGDLWLGYQGPDGGPGAVIRAGAGWSLLGSDELGLLADAGTGAGRDTAGGSSYGLQLYYRYFLGR